MNIIVVGSAKETGKSALKVIKKTLSKKPNAVICFPTGSSPLPLCSIEVSFIIIAGLPA